MLVKKYREDGRLLTQGIWKMWKSIYIHLKMHQRITMTIAYQTNGCDNYMIIKLRLMHTNPFEAVVIVVVLVSDHIKLNRFALPTTKINEDE